MFDDISLFEGDNEAEPQVQSKCKKRKCETQGSIHSSLDHHTLKAPPIIEYNSIDSYCERKRGESFLTSDNPHSSGSMSLQSVSSPIVLKTPNSKIKTVAVDNKSKPYVFFSVEELSLVKCLKNWSNTKVTAVGETVFNSSAGVYYLYSIGKDVIWKVLVDTSLLEHDPKDKQLLQVYGVLEIFDNKPRIKVNFIRELRTVDVQRFVESYELMQKYVPEPIVEWGSKNVTTVEKASCSLKENTSFDIVRLSDTLDFCDFSNIE